MLHLQQVWSCGLAEEVQGVATRLMHGLTSLLAQFTFFESPSEASYISCRLNSKLLKVGYIGGSLGFPLQSKGNTRSSDFRPCKLYIILY